MAMPGLTGCSDRIQSLPDTDIISHGRQLSLSALDNATTNTSDNNLSQNLNSTQREFTQMDNMCQDPGLQYAK
jgi:hypothetical protein